MYNGGYLPFWGLERISSFLWLALERRSTKLGGVTFVCSDGDGKGGGTGVLLESKEH